MSRLRAQREMDLKRREEEEEDRRKMEEYRAQQKEEQQQREEDERRKVRICSSMKRVESDLSDKMVWFFSPRIHSSWFVYVFFPITPKTWFSFPTTLVPQWLLNFFRSYKT